MKFFEEASLLVVLLLLPVDTQLEYLRSFPKLGQEKCIGKTPLLSGFGNQLPDFANLLKEENPNLQ